MATVRTLCDVIIEYITPRTLTLYIEHHKVKMHVITLADIGRLPDTVWVSPATLHALSDEATAGQAVTAHCKCARPIQV